MNALTQHPKRFADSTGGDVVMPAHDLAVHIRQMYMRIYIWLVYVSKSFSFRYMSQLEE